VAHDFLFERPGSSVTSSDTAPPLTLVVSIINYRTRDLTLACVQSVLADLGDIAGHVVVVDNRSDDGSAEAIEGWIAAQDPPVPVSLVRSATNSGFSGGHNQGISALQAEFYLVLNSDALVRPGFFRTLLDAARAAPQAGLFAPRIEYENGTQQISCFRFPSPASELIRGAASGPVTRALARYDMPLDMPPAPDQIGWASFACILLRNRMIDAIGLMDEGYFLYFEDTEYCWRARKAGWRILHVPEARAVHFRGGSAPVKALAQERKRLPAYYYASRTRFFHQAYGWAGLIAANALWNLGRGIAQMRRLAGKPVPQISQHETVDIWINALSPLGDRRATGD
jgi:N-acetylglucosaminyl-diphospho-decaprenol L-rhamnosyltransferase